MNKTIINIFFPGRFLCKHNVVADKNMLTFLRRFKTNFLLSILVDIIGKRANRMPASATMSLKMWAVASALAQP